MYGTYKFLTKYLQIKNLYIFIKYMSPVVSSNNPSESHNFQKKIGPYIISYHAYGTENLSTENFKIDNMAASNR